MKGLRTTAEALADEYARVREATDRLTRWHQLNATEQGRTRLGATPEPDEVTFTPPKIAAPEKDAAKKDPAKPESRTPTATGGGPAYDKPPWQSAGHQGVRRFDAATDHRTLSATDPDGSSYVFDLDPPSGGGNGFYAAVQGARGRGTRDAEWLAGQVAFSNLMPDDVALDPQAVFHLAELGSLDVALRNEIEANGGVLPDSARAGLTPEHRRRLIRLHVRKARQWDAATAGLAASISARTLGVDLTVVAEDGSYRHYSGARPDATGPLEQVTVYRRGDDYLAARPRRATPAPPVPEPTPPPTPKPDPFAAAAVQVATGHLGTIGRRPMLKLYAQAAVGGMFTSLRGAGGRVTATGDRQRKLIADVRTFYRHSESLAKDVGPHGPVRLYRAVQMDPEARSAEGFWSGYRRRRR